MGIQLAHLKYQEVQFKHDSLKLKGQEGEITLYRGSVQECSVTLVNSNIHIVALLGNQRLVHWHGQDDFLSEDLGREKLPVKGLQLLTDAYGKVHFFYLLQNVKQSDYVLIQRVYTDSWSEQLRVTTNISTMSDDYKVCPALENYLHLNYVSLAGDTLFYRCFDLENKIWSGAIPIVREECSSPQLYMADGNLLLTWISKVGDGKILKACWQQNTWEKPVKLSDISKDIIESGISWEEKLLTVNWIEGSHLHSRSYDQEWLDPKKIDFEEKRRKNKAALVEKSQACCTWFIYEPYITETSSVASTKSKSKETVDRREEVGNEASAESIKLSEAKESQEQKERRALEMKFWQEAFQLHQEWQELRKDYQAVLEQNANIEAKLEKQLRDFLQENTKQHGVHLEKRVSEIDHSFLKLTEEVQLTNQRIMSIRDDLRSIRQSGSSLRAVEQRIDHLESSLINRKTLESSYVSQEKRMEILERKINKLSEQITESNNTSRGRSIRAKSLLKRLIWR